MANTPTHEQQAVIDAALKRDNLVIQAGAGTGKTSTLQMVAAQLPKSSIYIAYNKSIASDAASRFPGHVTCKTSHSLAFGAVGKNFSHRLNSARQPSWEVAKALKLPWLNITRDIAVNPNHQARIAADTVRRFCYSADETITKVHVPFQNGIVGKDHDKLVSAILPIAQKWWADVNSTGGKLPFEHDHYLKMWALSNPVLKAEVIYLDEAQDSNPVLAKLVVDQECQQIVVGDGCQQMYAWRGSVDAMSDWPDATQLYLTQSWRFGQAVAEEANKWLNQLPTPLELTGNPGIDSTIESLDAPKAILCRTNAGAMSIVLDYLDQGYKVAIVGGGQALARLAQAATDLRNGKKTNHPELYAFADWDAVSRYAKEEASGRDLLPLVNLIDAHGTERIIEACQCLTEENHADVVVSTTHKAKGREWDTVKVANDFFQPFADEDGIAGTIPTGEAMIGYVAVTRARNVLDRSGLAWIDDYTDTVSEAAEGATW